MARTKAQKRKLSDSDSDSSSDVPVKKPRKSTQAADTTPRTAEELSHLSHADLIQHILTLQSRLETAKNSSTTPATPELSKETLAKKVAQLRSLMERQIRKAMTWKPSCKTGGATFSQDFLVPHEEVVRAVFRGVVSEKDAKKGWKMRKFRGEEFQVCFSHDRRVLRVVDG